jgi:hypothetical protein
MGLPRGLAGAAAAAGTAALAVLGISSDCLTHHVQHTSSMITAQARLPAAWRRARAAPRAPPPPRRARAPPPRAAQPPPPARRRIFVPIIACPARPAPCRAPRWPQARLHASRAPPSSACAAALSWCRPAAASGAWRRLRAPADGPMAFRTPAAAVNRTEVVRAGTHRSALGTLPRRHSRAGVRQRDCTREGGCQPRPPSLYSTDAATMLSHAVSCCQRAVNTLSTRCQMQVARCQCAVNALSMRCQRAVNALSTCCHLLSMRCHRAVTHPDGASFVRDPWHVSAQA